MADLFSGVDQSEGPFADVVLPTSDQAPPTALSRFRRAQVVAAAQLDTSRPDEAMQQFQSIQETYLRTAEILGDTTDDIEVAERRRQRQVSAAQRLEREAPNIDPTGELQIGASGAAAAAIQRDIEQDRKHALEQEAVDNILDLAASGNRTQAEALINLMENGSVLDQVRDHAAKQMILQREIDRAQGELAHEPWFSHVANFVLSTLPANMSMGQVGNVDTGSEVRNWFESIGDNVLSGRRRSIERANLWSMPIEQFTDYVRNHLIPNVHENATLFNYTDKSETLNLLTSMQQSPEVMGNNLGNALDNFGWIGASELVGATKAARAATNLPRMLVGLGARREASGALAAAAAKFTTEGVEEAVQKAGMESVNDVADMLTPTIARADGGDMVVPIQSAANIGLENGMRVRETLENTIQTGRFADEAEFEAAKESLIEQSKAAFGAGHVIDVSAGRQTLTDASEINTVKFTLSKGPDEGWASEAQVQAYKESIGFDDAEIIKGEGGQYFLSVERNMPETGFYTPLNPKTQNLWSRWLLGARQRSDEFVANRAQVSENARNKVITDHVRTLFKRIKLDPASSDRVNQLWALGDGKAKWFDLDEANTWFQRGFKRDISPKEWEAYQGLRDINDLEYAYRNDLRYKELVLKGHESVSFDAGGQYFDDLNAIVDDSFSRPIKGRALNQASGGYTSKLSAEDIERLRNDGYALVHLERPVDLPNGRELTSVIVKRDGLRRGRLSRDQLPYRAGGHRIYKEKYFVKQAYKTIDEDGNEIWKTPKTHIVGTKAEADEWARTMEAARKIAISDFPDVKAIDDLFGGRAGFPTAEKFLEGLESGKYSKDFEFVGLYDRELPSQYDNLDKNFFAGDAEEEGIISYLRTNGRLYYSQKGDTALTDWQGAHAPTLNAYESVNRAFMNIANLSSFHDYKITSVERWVHKFDSFIDKASVSPNASPMERFLDGRPTAGAGRDKILNGMEDQRNIIKRNLGWKTEADAKFDEVSRRFTEFVMGTDPTSLRHGVSRRVLNFMEDKNPIGSLRGMAFDLKLGMFNPVQYMLQANTFLAITAIAPMSAGKAVMTGPLLRRYLMRGTTEGTLDAYIKHGFHTAAGFSGPEEFKAFMGAAKNSGFFSINDSHSLVNAMGPNTVNLVGSKVKDARQMGRFFFNEGELINRMAAYRVAWDRAAKKYAQAGDVADDLVNTMSDKFLNEVFGQAETYAFSMSRTSQASWQQGLLSIPTQFFAYQARMMEMMFGGQLSRAERTRLILSQALLYGASGVPLAGVASDLIKSHTGTAPEIDSVAGFIDRGFLDWAINGVTGADVTAGARLGTGRFFGDTVGDLFGFSKYGETNTMDVVGGATYSITADLAKDLIPFIKYASMESGGDPGMPMTEKTLKDLAMNISTVSNVTKAMLIWNYGEYTTGGGRQMALDVPRSDAWFQLLLGAAPAENDLISARMSYQKDQTKVITEAANVVSQYRTEVLNHPERSEEVGMQINAFINLLDPAIRRKVLEKAGRPDPSLLDSLNERYERDQAERDMIKQMEGSANSGQSN